MELRSRKERTHQKILEAASRLFRSRGYVASGLDAVMSMAGLTAGGFYAHFPSKDALLVETISKTLEATRTTMKTMIDHLHGKPFLDAFVNMYLDLRHRDAIEEGCAIPALLSDLPRSKLVHRMAFEEQFKKSVSYLAGKFPKRKPIDDDFDHALVVVALCVGAIGLARSVVDPELSQRILTVCEKFLVVWGEAADEEMTVAAEPKKNAAGRKSRTS